jgi:hypothetical protein
MTATRFFGTLVAVDAGGGGLGEKILIRRFWKEIYKIVKT